MSDTLTLTQEELDAKIAEANAGLAKKRDELLSEAKRAKEEAKATKEALEAMQQKMAELEQKAAAKDAGVSEEKLRELTERARADMERKYAPLKEQVEALSAQLGQKDGELRSLRLDSRVKDIMGKGGARSERVNDLFRLTADRYDLTDDGDVILKDKREVPLDKYVREELANEYPEFFSGSGSSGGGASRSAGGAGGAVRTIAAGDNDAFLANLDAIAAGTAKVSP